MPVPGSYNGGRGQITNALFPIHMICVRIPVKFYKGMIIQGSVKGQFNNNLLEYLNHPKLEENIVSNDPATIIIL